MGKDKDEPLWPQTESIEGIADYHNEVEAALRFYFKEASPPVSPRLANYSLQEVLAARLEETDRRSVFALLTYLEAAFRVDYLFRCKKKLKDDISRKFREVYKLREEKARLDKDIFLTWRKDSRPAKKLLDELGLAFDFRDWFAHGRHWPPEHRQKYDFNYVYVLASNIVNYFDFKSD
jgi:hypothetical protein